MLDILCVLKFGNNFPIFVILDLEIHP